MKNILAENLLRFGAKNLNESHKRVLQLLIEQELSNITDGCAVAGATKTNVTTAAAAESFKNSDLGITINGTITNTSCIRKDAGATKLTWTVAPKSVNQAHYLKVGDKIIQGTSPSAMMVNLGDIKAQAVEAAGNGIYALYRAIKVQQMAMKAPYNMPTTAGLLIVLNGSGEIVNGKVFNLKTGFQGVPDRFDGDIIAVMIALRIINPNQEAKLKPSGTIEAGLGMLKANKGGNLGALAHPYLADQTEQEKDFLKTIGPIDVSSDPDVGKNFNNLETATAAAKRFASKYAQQYIDSVALKFKTYISMRIKSLGAPANVEKPLYDVIDSWKDTQKASDYVTNVVNGNALKECFAGTIRSGSAGVTGAQTTSGVVKGKEGSMGGQ